MPNTFGRPRRGESLSLVASGGGYVRRTTTPALWCLEELPRPVLHFAHA